MRHRIFVLALLLPACGSEAIGPAVSATIPPILSTAIISGRVPDFAAALDHGAVAPSPVVYVSLPPGTFPDGQALTIRNPHSGAEVEALLAEGGTDPVAIQAEPGNVLLLTILASTGTRSEYRATVPPRRPPVVVRTEPRPHKRDVPLNATIRVVFSEPMDPASIGPAAVVLRLNGVPVAGTIALDAVSPWNADFTPEEPLSPGSDYELIVTQSARDRDGEALEVQYSAPFITMPSTSGNIRVTVVTTGTPPAEGFLVRSENQNTQVQANGSVTLRGFGAVGPVGGFHEVELIDSRGKCRSESGGQYARVAPGSTVNITFHVDCAPLEIGPLSSQKIAFVRGGQIFAATESATQLVPLTTDGTNEGPEWSPDGNRLVFARYQGIESGIYLRNANGLTLRRGLKGFGPSWSPDGRRILYTHEPQAMWALLFVAPADDDGTSPAWFGPGGGTNLDPAWSPDGAAIALATNDEIAGHQIDIINTDGTGRRSLTQWRRHTDNYAPAWSPDGSMIAYLEAGPLPVESTVRVSRYTVVVMNRDGSNRRTLAWAGDASWHGQVGTLSWSPDGTRIAFTSIDCDLMQATVCTNVRSIKWVSPDGTQQGMLIRNGHSPTWRR